jgi:nucleotide-binding universal stress UspA family protein
VPLATLVAEGDPAESLIVAARDAELLVVGTRGRSPFAGLALGSVSQRCAAAAPCPVVLVKQDGDTPG